MSGTIKTEKSLPLILNQDKENLSYTFSVDETSREPFFEALLQRERFSTTTEVGVGEMWNSWEGLVDPLRRSVKMSSSFEWEDEDIRPQKMKFENEIPYLYLKERLEDPESIFRDKKWGVGVQDSFVKNTVSGAEEFEEKLEDSILRYEKKRISDIIFNWDQVVEREDVEWKSELGSLANENQAFGQYLLEEGEKAEHSEPEYERSELAGQVLEMEYYRDNPEKILESDTITDREVYVLADIEEQEMEELFSEIEDLAPKGQFAEKKESVDISSTWRDTWGNLMGYDCNDGKPVKLLDSDVFDKVERVRNSGTGLEQMMESTKQEFDSERDYRNAALSSIIDNDYGKDVEEWFIEDYVSEDLSSLRELNQTIFAKLYSELRSENSLERSEPHFEGHLYPEEHDIDYSKMQEKEELEERGLMSKLL